MIVLTRKIDESIVIGDNITVTIVEKLNLKKACHAYNISNGEAIEKFEHLKAAIEMIETFDPG